MRGLHSSATKKSQVYMRGLLSSATGPTRLGPKNQRSFNLCLVSSFNPEGRVVPYFLLSVEPQRLHGCSPCLFHGMRSGVRHVPRTWVLGLEPKVHRVCTLVEKVSPIPPLPFQGSTHNNCASAFGSRAGLTTADTSIGCLSFFVSATPSQIVPWFGCSAPAPVPRAIPPGPRAGTRSALKIANHTALARKA